MGSLEWSSFGRFADYGFGHFRDAAAAVVGLAVDHTVPRRRRNDSARPQTHATRAGPHPRRPAGAISAMVRTLEVRKFRGKLPPNPLQAWLNDSLTG